MDKETIFEYASEGEDAAFAGLMLMVTAGFVVMIAVDNGMSPVAAVGVVILIVVAIVVLAVVAIGYVALCGYLVTDGREKARRWLGGE